MATKDVQTIESGDVATLSGLEYELATAAILDGVELPAVDPEQVSRRIIEQLLEADTFEQVFAPQARLHAWREYLGRPAIVDSVHFNRSKVKDATASIYAVVDLTWTDTGETDTVTCGGRNVLAQLLAGLKRGWLPGSRELAMVSRDTAEGYSTLYLEAAGNPLDE